MQFNEYQTEAAKTAIFPKEKGLEYTVLGLVSEAGEIAGKVKKIIRDKQGVMSPEDRVELLKEVGDVLWYTAAITSVLEGHLVDVAENNIAKLQSRMVRGVLGGSGDNR